MRIGIEEISGTERVGGVGTGESTEGRDGVEWGAQRVRFPAGRNSLTVTACGSQTFLFSYDFADAPPPSVNFGETFPFLDVHAPPIKPDAPALLVDDPDDPKDPNRNIRVRADGEPVQELLVDRGTGNVSVYRKDRLVHGGAIGTQDTVIPDRQLRVVGPPMTGRFHFPLEEEDEFFGLGEKTGPFNRRGRRFKMFNRDALGYDADVSDPLYKSIPFFIRRNVERDVYIGVFFPAPRTQEIDFGVESRYYYAATIDRGPFAYYLFTGDGYEEVLDAYTRLTGRPALPPLFTFGYLGSSMDYAEPLDAEQRVGDFFDRIEEHAVPCEGIYLSSGYAKADNGQRYSFIWNPRKFPDPARFVQSVRNRGYRITCNVKPGILTGHPWYEELAAGGHLIADEEGVPYREYYWGGDASLVDFARPKTVDWWRRELRKRYFDRGVRGIWNDNNECELEDPSLPAADYRALYPLLMAKASWDEVRMLQPGRRPWIISRAGWAGMQALARSWTGDNVSTFRSMRGNILMGLGLGASGVPFFGHDVGGFFGPTPSKELLVRWAQNAALQPRFVVHSWNSESSPTELWTYPSALPVLRDIIRERYRLLPYLYNEALRTALSGVPMQRALALEYPKDRELSTEATTSLVGPWLLVPAATHSEQEAVEVSLPAGANWYDPQHEFLYDGGRSVRIVYPVEGLRFLVRTGSVIPTAPGLNSLDTGFFESVVFQLFPENGQETRYLYYEDDGEHDYKTGEYGEYLVELTPSEAQDESAVVSDPVEDRWKLRFEVLEAGLQSTEKGIHRRMSFALPLGFRFTDVGMEAAQAQHETGLSDTGRTGGAREPADTGNEAEPEEPRCVSVSVSETGTVYEWQVSGAYRPASEPRSVTAAVQSHWGR